MLGLLQKYSCYTYEIFEYPDDYYPNTKYYYYKIYTKGCPPYYDGIIESDNDMFETEQEANFAAIGHIDLLENGPDNKEDL